MKTTTKIKKMIKTFSQSMRVEHLKLPFKLKMEATKLPKKE